MRGGALVPNRSALNHSALIRAVGLSMLLALSVLTMLPDVSEGQTCTYCACPTGWTGPTGWSYTAPGGCNVTVWFCDSLDAANKINDRMIEEIDISDTNNCTDDIAIIWSADSAVMDYPLGAPYCGTTNPPYTIQTVFQASCWSAILPLPGQPWKDLLPCQQESFVGWCLYTCNVCRIASGPDEGQIQTSNCSVTSKGFPKSCELPPPGNNFAFGHCYVVGCNPND